ncbi:MAG: SRPBCC domain-containing protein [Acidimicrobiaceae bacterium]|nr:SRPBCC domain-containing protein [Acidimicrobiaceae bacterium]
MIRRQMTFPVAPDRLWTELTDADAASEWMGARVDWALIPGGPARFEEEDGRRWTGRVDEVEPNRRLRFRWWPDDGEGSPSEVTYDLSPEPDGTQLTVTERPLAEAPTASAARAQAETWSAWDTRLLGTWARAAAWSEIRA